jgi:hypothetical protein
MFRGTSMIGAGKLSRYRIFIRGTSAAKAYKLYRSHKFITVQDLNYGQMRALPAVASAKAGVRVPPALQSYLGSRSKSKKCDNLSREAGNNLPILSVLAFRCVS